MPKRPESIKRVLNAIYRDCDFASRIKNDPIEFPYRYEDSRDREISGFIACCFAYGKVELFKTVVGKLFALMGSSPYNFLLEFRPQTARRLLYGIRYRFNSTEDIICLLFILSRVLIGHETIENAFLSFYREEDGTIENGLSGLMGSFIGTETSMIYGKDIRPRGLLQFFPSPAGGSACKRANLFLRWMIRDSDIDFGIWKSVPKNKLVIPLDTHVARISRCMGLTRRKGQDWKTALEITEALRKLDPEDPLKYDFALCHKGISGFCRGLESREICPRCALKRDRK